MTEKINKWGTPMEMQKKSEKPLAEMKDEELIGAYKTTLQEVKSLEQGSSIEKDSRDSVRESILEKYLNELEKECAKRKINVMNIAA